MAVIRPVVDEERGIVLSVVRFGLKEGMEAVNPINSNDRLVMSPAPEFSTRYQRERPGVRGRMQPSR
jgi:hypothetical protein